VNVWLALSYLGHVHHGAALAWFRALDEDARLCFCRITQLSLLRLITMEAVMGADDVLSQTEAWNVYDRWFDDTRVIFLEEPAGLESLFRSFSRLPHPAAKDWSDSYLLAFANAADLSLVTFDRTLKQRAASAILLH
jgi:toxin-antitoxin system PIN domain toxin